MLKHSLSLSLSLYLSIYLSIYRPLINLMCSILNFRFLFSTILPAVWLVYMLSMDSWMEFFKVIPCSRKVTQQFWNLYTGFTGSLNYWSFWTQFSWLYATSGGRSASSTCTTTARSCYSVMWPTTCIPGQELPFTSWIIHLSILSCTHTMDFQLYSQIDPFHGKDTLLSFRYSSFL